MTYLNHLAIRTSQLEEAKIKIEQLERENVELKQELAKLREENAILKSQVENAGINLEQMRLIEQAKCREDKERLDWLESMAQKTTDFDICHRKDTGFIVEDMFNPFEIKGKGETLRSAIDAAKKGKV